MSSFAFGFTVSTASCQPAAGGQWARIGPDCCGWCESGPTFVAGANRARLLRLVTYSGKPANPSKTFTYIKLS